MGDEQEAIEEFEHGSSGSRVVPLLAAIGPEQPVPAPTDAVEPDQESHEAISPSEAGAITPPTKKSHRRRRFKVEISDDSASEDGLSRYDAASSRQSTPAASPVNATLSPPSTKEKQKPRKRPPAAGISLSQIPLKMKLPTRSPSSLSSTSLEPLLVTSELKALVQSHCTRCVLCRRSCKKDSSPVTSTEKPVLECSRCPAVMHRKCALKLAEWVEDGMDVDKADVNVGLESGAGDASSTDIRDNAKVGAKSITTTEAGVSSIDILITADSGTSSTEVFSTTEAGASGTGASIKAVEGEVDELIVAEDGVAGTSANSNDDDKKSVDVTQQIGTESSDKPVSNVVKPTIALPSECHYCLNMADTQPCALCQRPLNSSRIFRCVSCNMVAHYYCLLQHGKLMYNRCATEPRNRLIMAIPVKKHDDCVFETPIARNFRCWECRSYDVLPEKILSNRVLVDEMDDTKPLRMEYLVKFAGLSYLWLRWVTEHWLSKQAKSLLTVYKKRNAITADWMASASSKMNVDGVDDTVATEASFEEYLEVGRVLAAKISRDPGYTAVAVLVKWEKLGYQDVSWELVDVQHPIFMKILEHARVDAKMEGLDTCANRKKRDVLATEYYKESNEKRVYLGFDNSKQSPFVELKSQPATLQGGQLMPFQLDGLK